MSFCCLAYTVKDTGQQTDGQLIEPKRFTIYENQILDLERRANEEQPNDEACSPLRINIQKLREFAAGELAKK